MRAQYALAIRCFSGSGSTSAVPPPSIQYLCISSTAIDPRSSSPWARYALLARLVSVPSTVPAGLVASPAACELRARRHFFERDGLTDLGLLQWPAWHTSRAMRSSPCSPRWRRTLSSRGTSRDWTGECRRWSRRTTRLPRYDLPCLPFAIQESVVDCHRSYPSARMPTLSSPHSGHCGPASSSRSRLHPPSSSELYHTYTSWRSTPSSCTCQCCPAAHQTTPSSHP